MSVKTLAERVGETVHLIIPFIHASEFQHVKLLAVEAGGIWIESATATQMVFAALKIPAGKTPVLFVPYGQIRFGFDASDEISLSDKAFGV